MDKRNVIIENLKILQNIETKNKQPFKARAYAKVIKELKETDIVITSMDDLKGVNGIGKSMQEKLKSIIEQGYTEATKDIIEKSKVQDQDYKIIEHLMEIMAIGPVKARELVENHGIKSVEHLREHEDLLNEKQKLGLKYHEHFIARIPREEMIKHKETISAIISSIDKNLVYEITGSFRRGKKDSGDIDVLVTYNGNSTQTIANNNFKKIVDKLKENKYLVDDFAFGDKKYNGVCKLPRHKRFRRIDIMFTEPDKYPFALLYFTGSQQFNIAMRNRALELGYSLNEYSLKKIGSAKNDSIDHIFHNEKDVFNFLKIKYVEPEDRENAMIIPLLDECNEC